MASENLFVGVGGCGINTVIRLIKGGMAGAFLCIDRDTGHMGIVPENVRKILLPQTVEFPVSEPWISQIRGQMDGAKRIFLFVGLGSHTGTSLAIQLSQIREMEIYATYPFALERQRRKIADEALPQIKGKVHLRRNDELATNPDTKLMPMSECFRMVDDKLGAELKKELGE